MHRWHKYFIDPEVAGSVRIGPDDDYLAHEKSMGGYGLDDGYGSAREFFAAHFTGFQLGRLEHYRDFLSRNLPRDADALSIASGRCAVELKLMEEGWRPILCTDLGPFGAADATRALFPEFRYEPFDVLAGPSATTHDAVLALSLIYLFDAAQLDAFFRNVAASLKPGGRLIMDAAGAPDNATTRFYHDIYLRWETKLKAALKSLLERRAYGFVDQEFGYHRTDEEIVAAASHAGFTLVAAHTTGYDVELTRSMLLGRLARVPVLGKVLDPLWRRMPYMRLFAFDFVGVEPGADGSASRTED